VGKSSFTRTQV